MNAIIKSPPGPLDDVREHMLAAVAAKLELLPTRYKQFSERRNRIEKYLQRDGSPLKDRIEMIYPQGSVAIGATIRPSFKSDDIDLDLVVELKESPRNPGEALDSLFEAMGGNDPDSRYHGMIKRQTRCITVQYQDGMHIDLTPSERLNFGEDRLSDIFHAKPGSPEGDRRVRMNSYAFAGRFNAQCPPDQALAEEYSKTLLAEDEQLVARLKKIVSEPMPDHSSEVGGKSEVTIALQLIKRYIAIRWHGRRGRKPPSVMLSCLTLDVAAPGRSISQNLKIIAEHIRHGLVDAKRRGKTIKVVNPRCPEDEFTDRWPENLAAQDLLIEDIRYLMDQLDNFFGSKPGSGEQINALKEMFGEGIGQQVVEDFEKKLTEAIKTGNHRTGAATGGVIVSASAAAAAQPSAPRSTFYGGELQRYGRQLVTRRRKRLKMKSIQTQIESMKRRWPQLRHRRGFGAKSVIWEGRLKGLDRVFLVRIEYGLPHVGGLEMFRMMPVVRVLAPELIPNFDDKQEGPLPHVYKEFPHIQYSPLCLFDPDADEWNWNMLISETIVVWASRWLAAYEWWEATGRWIGGGRHPNPRG